METRGNTYQFRSVPLIQRGDWSTLSGGSATTGARDRSTSHAAARPSESLREREERSRDERRRPRDDDRTSRRTRRRRDDREHDRERTRDRSRTRDGRRRRRDQDDGLRDQAMREAPRESKRLRADRTETPPRTHVSAYLDESTVVGVTPRSERRGQVRPSGFTVVPPMPEVRPRVDRAQTRPRAYDSAARFGDDVYRGWDSGSVDRSWNDGGSIGVEWGGPSPYDEQPSWHSYRADDVTSRLDSRTTSRPDPRRASRPHDEERLTRRSRRPREDGSVARDWLYAGDEGGPWDTPGAARRREAVVGALTAVPSAALNGLLALLAHTRGLFVLILAVMTAFMLYAPARELYVANRRLDTLQATYEALLEENDTIRSDLELLQSREGIENEARARGYVVPGETKVIVEGLPEDDDQGALEYLEPIELPDTRPWYTKLLDQLFNYNPEE